MASNPQDLITAKSPLALVGIFLEILRHRFAPSQGGDYVYHGYNSTFDGSDDGRQSSEIHIEAGGQDNVEEEGHRPAIYVNRGPINISQPVIGDMAGANFKCAGRWFYAIATTNFTFTVESTLAAESERIADIVLSTLLMGSDYIEGAFGFRKLGPFALSSRGTMRQDTNINTISVNMGLSYDVRWATMDLAPILKELIVKVKDSSYTSNNEYFTEIYQNSLADSPNSTN